MKTERELTYNNTTIIVSGTLKEGEKETGTNPPIADHFEGESYEIRAKIEGAISRSNEGVFAHINITQPLADLNDLITQHPMTCPVCKEKVIYNLLEMIDEKLNQ